MGGNDVGSRVKVKVVKNKCAPPFQGAEFDIVFNEGISHVGSLVDIGTDFGIIDKKGTWFSFQTHRLGQGREAAKEELKRNPKIAEEIEKAVYAKIAEGATIPKKGVIKEEALV